VSGKRLHAKYHGPYAVEQQLGPVDYIISTPDRRKTKRVCHVNLLKPYHVRDPQLDPTVTTIPADVLLQTPNSDDLECLAPTSVTSPTSVIDTLMLKTDGQLTPARTVDLTSLLTEYDNVFSDVPGRTTLGEHRTELMPGTKPIRCTPYRLSPEKAKVPKDELGNHLRQGIIEESVKMLRRPFIFSALYM